MDAEEFEALRDAHRQFLLKRWQEEKRWGGNHVPRGQIMPSYRALGANPALPVMRQPEVEPTVYLNAEAAPAYPTAGLVFDLRKRKRGMIETILKPLEDD
jgi:hypothetical protein